MNRVSLFLKSVVFFVIISLSNTTFGNTDDVALQPANTRSEAIGYFEAIRANLEAIRLADFSITHEEFYDLKEGMSESKSTRRVIMDKDKVFYLCTSVSETRSNYDQNWNYKSGEQFEGFGISALNIRERQLSDRFFPNPIRTAVVTNFEDSVNGFLPDILCIGLLTFPQSIRKGGTEYRDNFLSKMMTTGSLKIEDGRKGETVIRFQSDWKEVMDMSINRLVKVSAAYSWTFDDQLRPIKLDVANVVQKSSEIERFPTKQDSIEWVTVHGIHVPSRIQGERKLRREINGKNQDVWQLIDVAIDWKSLNEPVDTFFDRSNKVLSTETDATKFTFENRK